MALSKEEIADLAKGVAREVLKRHGIPEVIDSRIVSTVVEMGLKNCDCARKAKSFSYELATIQHGNLISGIPDPPKVAKAIEFFGNNVDERSYGAYLKSADCPIGLPWGASHKRLQELYKEDWTKANNLLGEISSAVNAEANRRGGGACDALELLYQGLLQTKRLASLDHAPKVTEFEGKRYTLVGTERDESKAEIWAANMREHGEKVEITEFQDGFALYREE